MWSGIETFTESMFACSLSSSSASPGRRAPWETLLQPLESGEVDVGDGDEIERRVFRERHGR